MIVLRPLTASYSTGNLSAASQSSRYTAGHGGSQEQPTTEEGGRHASSG